MHFSISRWISIFNAVLVRLTFDYSTCRFDKDCISLGFFFFYLLSLDLWRWRAAKNGHGKIVRWSFRCKYNVTFGIDDANLFGCKRAKYGKNVQNTIKMTDKLFKCYFLSLSYSRVVHCILLFLFFLWSSSTLQTCLF